MHFESLITSTYSKCMMKYVEVMLICIHDCEKMFLTGQKNKIYMLGGRGGDTRMHNLTAATAATTEKPFTVDSPDQNFVTNSTINTQINLINVFCSS